MQTNKDLYKVLGVSRDASQDAVQQAHRKLVRKYHPDANAEDPQAEERFKEIQQAYETLSNPQKRREYDKRFHTSSKEDSRRSPAGAAGRRTRAGTTYTLRERVTRNGGLLFSLGYLLGIALVALVIALLIMLVVRLAS